MAYIYYQVQRHNLELDQVNEQFLNGQCLCCLEGSVYSTFSTYNLHAIQTQLYKSTGTGHITDPNADVHALMASDTIQCERVKTVGPMHSPCFKIPVQKHQKHVEGCILIRN